MAALARSSSFTGAGINSVASLLPRVIVPVLSSKTIFTSPAASIALPLKAITLWLLIYPCLQFLLQEVVRQLLLASNKQVKL